MSRQLTTSKIILLGLSALIVTSISVLAQAPAQLSYQGFLTAQSGRPLEGSFNIEFRIYDVLQGGTMDNILWQQAPHTISVDQGIFNVLLPHDFNGDGSIDPTVDAEPLTLLESPLGSIFTGTKRFLELTVNGETLIPRQQITSVPFALKAESATIDILVMANEPIGQAGFNDGYTDVAFVERHDTADAASNGPPFSFSAPVAGLYRLSALLSLDDPNCSDGGVCVWRPDSYAQLVVRSLADEDLKVLAAASSSGGDIGPAGGEMILSVSGDTLLELSEGDEIKFSVLADFLPANSVLTGDPAENWLSIEYVRPLP